MTRKNGRALTDLFEWFEAPYALVRPCAGQTMRTEEGVENGRYLVRAELPGLDPEKQAEVTLSKGILTIHAEREEQTDNAHRSEFRYGSFTRHVTLPASANQKDVEASYDRGILEVSVGLKAKDEAEDAAIHVPVRMVEHIKPT